MIGQIALVLSLALAGEAPTAAVKAPVQQQSTMPTVKTKTPAQTEKKAEKPTKEPEFQLTGAEHNVLELTNKARVARGLPPYIIDPSLVESARQHANWMASMRIMRHTSKPVGENIAQGQANSTSAVNTWMNSPPHRANILSRSWNRVGAAAYTSPEGRIYWCLQFLR